MPDIQQTLYDFDATIKAHPEYSEEELLRKFPEFGNDRNKLQSAYDYSATVNSGRYRDSNEINTKFPEFFSNENEEGAQVPFYLQRQETEQASPLRVNPQFDEDYVAGFVPGFKQGTKALTEGSKVVAANTANLFTGSSRDAERAIDILERYKDGDYNAREAYLQDRRKRYESEMGEYTKKMEEWYKKHPNILDRAKSMLPLVGDMPKRPNNPFVSGGTIGETNIIGSHADMRPYQLVAEALKQGDVEAAKSFLTGKSQKKTWGDKTEEAATEELSQLKPTKGAAAWVGNMAPQMAPNALAVAASVHPATRPLAKPLGIAGMGILSASSGGSAIAEARQYAKDKNIDVPESDILKAGTIATAIEIGTEYIPFSRYMSGAGSMVRKRLGKEVTQNIISNPAARKEIDELFKKAARNIPGNINKKTIKSFAGDVTAESLSEFSAETLGALVPALYSNEEDYPTLLDIVRNGIEGAKGGLFMGAFLGGGSKFANNYAQNQRRKQQGKITFADTDAGVVEVLGEEKNQFIVLDESGEVKDISKTEVKESTTVGWDEFKQFADELKKDNVSQSTVNNLTKSVSSPVTGDAYYEMLFNPSLPDMDFTDTNNYVGARVSLLQSKQAMDTSLTDADFSFDASVAELPVEEQKRVVADVIADDSLTDEQKQSIIKYLSAAAVEKKMQSTRQQLIDEQVAQAEKELTKNINLNSGTLVTAHISGSEQPLQVIGGLALKTDENGKLIPDIDNSDEAVFYLDQEGNPHPTTAENLEIESSDELEPQLAALRNQIEQQNQIEQANIAAAAEQYLNPQVTPSSEFVTGQTSEMPDGGVAQIIAINPDGSYSVEIEPSNGEITEQTFLPEEMENIGFRTEVSAPVQGNAAGTEALSFENETSPVSEINTQETETNEEETEINPVEAEKDAFIKSLPVIESGKNAGTIDQSQMSPEQTLRYFEYTFGKDRTLSAAEVQVKNLRENLNKEKSKLSKDPFNIAQNGRVEALENELKLYSDYVDAERMIGISEQIQRQEENPTSIADDHRQRSEEIQSQEAKRTGTASENITEKWNKAEKISGIEDQITLANGEKITGRYVLVNAGALSPSHDIARNFAKTEGFPVNEQGKTVNDRDYESDQQAQILVQQRANNYDERAVQTPVVVSSEGVVLSGNDRTMSGQLAAQQGTDEAYNGYITRYAQRWGFTPEQVEAMLNPRIVFVPDEAMPYNTATFAKFNAEEKKTQNSLEAAIKASKSVSREAIIPLSQVVSEFDKLNDFYDNPAAAKRAVQIMIDNGIIGTNEIPRMMDGAVLSREGRSFVETLMLGSVLQEQALRETDKVRSVRQTLMRTMPQLIRNAGLGEYSLIDELNNAIHLLYEAKQSGNVVELHMMQSNMFEASAADIYNELERLLANIMENEKDSDFRSIFEQYNSRATDIESGQIDIFDGILSKTEVLQKILANYGQKQENSPQQNGTPPAVDKRSEEPGDGTAERGSDERSAEPVDGTEQQSGITDTPSFTGDIVDYARNIVKNDELHREGEKVDPAPSNAQKAAGNYQKGHINIQGFDITIENPKGSVRSGVDEDGRSWQTEMKNHYGYFKRTEGKDGGHIDVFIGPNPESRKVFVIDQVKIPGIKFAPNEYRNKYFQINNDRKKERSQFLEDAEKVREKAEESLFRQYVKERGPLYKENSDIRLNEAKRDSFNNPEYKSLIESANGIKLYSPDEVNSLAVKDYANTIEKHFDESKVMLGFLSADEAREAYLSNYEQGWQGLGAITETNVEDFKKWLYDGAKQRKPFSEYAIPLSKRKNNYKYLSDSIDRMDKNTSEFHSDDADMDAYLNKNRKIEKEVSQFASGLSLQELKDLGDDIWTKPMIKDRANQETLNKIIQSEIIDKRNRVEIDQETHETKQQLYDAIQKAKAEGKTSFELSGKTYNKDIRIKDKDVWYEGNNLPPLTRNNKALTSREQDIPVMTEEEYLSINGAPFMAGAEPGIHKNVKRDRNKDKNIERVQKAMRENNQRREDLRKEYAQKVANGEIRKPTHIEELIKTANGHEDNEATQAARRLLKKRGVDWRNQEDNSIFTKNTTHEKRQKYTTRNGRQLQFDLFSSETQNIQKFGNEADDVTSGSGTLQRENNPFQNKLRRLAPGEFSYVERIFTEKTHFDFTGSERIETAEDVVAIFDKLEDSSIENAFAVFVKKGKAIIQHLGIGDFTSTSVNAPALIEGAHRINPDKVYFIHNHPSGNLEASTADKQMFIKIKSALGDKLQDGIIINLKTGKYGVFNGYSSAEETKAPKKGDVLIKTYSFDKQVFDKNYNPKSLSQIRSSEDVAKFLSGHRLGDRPKVNFLVLGTSNQVIGNFFTAETSITDENISQLAETILSDATTYGGTGVILYGGFYDSVSPSIILKFTNKFANLTSGDIRLLDVISINKEGGVDSATDSGVMEDVSRYGTSGYDDIRYISVTGKEIREAGNKFDNAETKEERYQAGLDVIDVLQNTFAPIAETVLVRGREELMQTLINHGLSEKYASEYGESKKNIEGVFYQSKVFINSNSMDNASELLDTWLHEQMHAYNKINPENIVSLEGKIEASLFEEVLPETGYEGISEQTKINELLAFLTEKVINDEALPDHPVINATIKPIIVNFLNDITNGQYSKTHSDILSGRGGTADARTDNPQSLRKTSRAIAKGIETGQQRPTERVNQSSDGRISDAGESITSGKPIYKIGQPITHFAEEIAEYNREHGHEPSVENRKPAREPGKSIADYATEINNYNESAGIRFRVNPPNIPKPPVLNAGMSIQEVADMVSFFKNRTDEIFQDVNREMSKISSLYTAFVDRARPLEKLLSMMSEKGAKISSETDAYMDYMTSASRATHLIQEYEKTLIEPLQETLNKVIRSGKLKELFTYRWDVRDELTGEIINDKNVSDYDRISLYLQAKDIVEAATLKGVANRGAEGFSKNVKYADGKDVAPESYIKEFEKAVGKETIDDIWTKVRATNRWALDLQLQHGLITPEVYTEYTSGQREYYVPQRGWRERDLNDNQLYYVTDKDETPDNPFNSALVKARGRSTLAGDPLAYMQSIGESSVMAALKNQTKQKFLQFAEDNSDFARMHDFFFFKRVYYVNTGKFDADGNALYERTYEPPTQEQLDEDKETAKKIEEIGTRRIEARTNYVTNKINEAQYDRLLDRLSKKEADLRNSIHVKYADSEAQRIAQVTAQERKQHTVIVLREGKEYEIQFSQRYSGERVANVLNRNFGKEVDGDLKFMQQLNENLRRGTRVMSALMTQYNPTFAVANSIRDYGIASISNIAEFGPAYQLRFQKNLIVVQRAVWQYSSNEQFDGDNPYTNGYYGNLLKEFFEDGAATGWSFLKDIEKLRTDMKRAIDPKTKDYVLRGKLGVYNAFGLKQTFGMLTEVSELTTRFAEYVTSREQKNADGTLKYSRQEAAQHAKEITVNFDRKGNQKFFGTLFSFFNASVQGTNKILRMIRNKRVRAMMAGTASALMVGGLLQALLMPDPDDDEERLWTEWELMNNVCFGKVKLPLPQGLRAFWGIGTQAGLAGRGRKGIAEAVADGTKYFFGELIPEQLVFWINGVEIDEKTGNLSYNPTLAVRGAIPTTVQPLYDVWQNTNFMGGTSYRTEFTNALKDTKAERTMGKRNVSPAAQDLSNLLWRLGGGDVQDNSRLKKEGTEVVQGIFDINPSVIETLTRGYAAGTGKFAMDMYTLAEQIISPDKKVDISTMAIANVLYKQPREYSALDSKMWQLDSKLDFYKTQFNDIKKNNPERYRRITSFHTRKNMQLRKDNPVGFQKQLEKYGTNENRMFDLLYDIEYFQKSVDAGKIGGKPAEQQADLFLELFRELQ